MIQYGNHIACTQEEMLDKHFGPKGTPRRDAFDAAVEEDVRAFLARQEAERATEDARKKLFEDVEEPDAVMA